MGQRALHALRLAGPFAIAFVLTWLVSWLLQILCWVTISGQRFSVSSRDVNRLAFATVATVIVVAVIIMFVLTLGGCWLFFNCLFWGPSVVAAIGWEATATFPGTPVATTLAQVIYGIAVLIWGIMMWYIFLGEVTDKLSES
jgi:hypothetical protein